MIKIHKRCINCNNYYIVPVYSRRHNSKYCSLSCNTTYRNLTNNPVKKEGVRNKISLSKKGRPSYIRTKETLKKMSNGATGENHWNWQGGKTKETLRLRGTYKYREWRSSVFERDNYTCQICGVKGSYLNADHIKPWSKYPDLRFDINNGRTLCLECHYKTDTFGYKAVAMR